jgi:SsrA-binding protein
MCGARRLTARLLEDPMAAKRSSRKKGSPDDVVIENRRARYDYAIEDTLEVGLKLRGTEVKSIRDGQASLAEGWVRASAEPLSLTLHGVHIAEYPNAAPSFQHEPVRTRQLLAHAKEIRRLAIRCEERGVTLVPLKIYFKGGRAKLLVGVGRGRARHDKRQAIAKREAAREIDRALSKR